MPTHRKGPVPPVIKKPAVKKTLLWGVIVIIGIGVVAAFAGWFADQAVQGMTGARDQAVIVGPRDEVEVRLPPRSWGQICTDKPALIRLAEGGEFRLEPPCKVVRQSDSVSVPSMGDNTSGILYVKAAPSEKMARVTITTVRK